MLYDSAANGDLSGGEILLNILYDNWPVLFIHEIAHYYDLYCFKPFGKFSSQVSPEFDQWRSAIHATPTFEQHMAILTHLSGIHESAVIDADTGQSIRFGPVIGNDWMNRLYAEAFARCFCQWLVRRWVRVNEHEFQTVVDHFHQERASDEAQILASYWSEDEMKVLAPIMDRLLRPII